MERWRSELYHDGIPGMKWGIRRYQNYDGSLTQAGRLRYGKIIGKEMLRQLNDEKKPPKDFAAQEAKYNKLHKNTSAIANNTALIFKNVGVLENYNRNKKKSKIDVSDMSDDELRELTNRMNLEQNYKELVLRSQPYKASASEYINTVAAVTGIGASVVGIASGIMSIRANAV